MKLATVSKLILTMMVFVGPSAFAHPQLWDPSSAVPAGSTISTRAALNIPPNVDLIYVNGGVRVPDTTVDGGTFCRFYVKHKSQVDRIVQPRNMPITKIEPTRGGLGLYYIVYVQDPVVDSIYCRLAGFDLPDTLENFFNIVEGVGGFQVYFPRPTRVNFEWNSDTSQVPELQTL